MSTRIFLPHPALQPYIQNYLYYEAGASDQWTKIDISPTALPVIPFAMSTDEIVFKEWGRRESLMFLGQLTEFSHLDYYGWNKVFLTFFKPFGAYKLLGIPQIKLKDMMWNLSDLLGPSARILNVKLMERTNPVEVKRLVESFILQHLAKQKKDDKVIRLAHAIDQLENCYNQNNVIKKICCQNGYSISTFERHMHKIAGIGPKMLQRIIRFKNVLRYIKVHQPPYHWAGIAYKFGYYDQTHFIKDFAWFYGTTPGKLKSITSKLQLSLNSTGAENSSTSVFRVYE
jgi:AraC-like DNA-binding protein